jgi:hypothetical protein
MIAEGSRAVAAAIRRFPGRAEGVRHLAERSGAFLDMCEELVAAEEALALIEASLRPDRPERRAECEGWIVRLTAEMGEALRQPEVIPLPLGRKRP